MGGAHACVCPSACTELELRGLDAMCIKKMIQNILCAACSPVHGVAGPAVGSVQIPAYGVAA